MAYGVWLESLTSGSRCLDLDIPQEGLLEGKCRDLQLYTPNMLSKLPSCDKSLVDTDVNPTNFASEHLPMPIRASEICREYTRCDQLPLYE
jgi:hypothetical protein